MRLWGKIMKNGKLLRDLTVTDDGSDTRTHRILHALEEICRTMDLGVPLWLETNVRDFQRYKKTRFYQDSFVGEQIDFDFLEFQILEE